MNKTKLLIATLVALFADLIQVILMPLFIGGALEPWDSALDFLTAGILTSLLGWHWVFLPTLIAEMAPVADVAPFWTLSVFYVALRGGKKLEPAIQSGAPILKDVTPSALSK